MDEIFINDIVMAVEGKLLYSAENLKIKHISTNSKDIKENTLFVPIVGKRFDAHEFIEDVFKEGAVATFVQKDINISNKENKAVIKVKDTLKALQQLATWYRHRLIKTKIIAVSGSVGKTSTKEIISCAISQKHKVLKTSGNQNSQIGVPLTIFNIEQSHDFAVVEMGMSEFGEMQRISDIVKADFCVISNIGLSHIENLKTQENILKEKLHAADYIDENGKLFLNGDDPILLEYYRQEKNKNCILFGENEQCEYKASDISSSETSTTFTLSCPCATTQIEIPSVGKHNVKNALAAIAVASSLGIDIEEIKEGLSLYKSPKMRQEIHRANGITIIDDSYNASPDSAKSGIDVLKTIKANRYIVLLADMLELGEFADVAHFQLGKYIAENNIDHAICIGKFSHQIKKGIESCVDKTDVQICNSNKEAYKAIKNILKQGDAVLVKGSRGMHTEEIVNDLLV